MLNDDIRRMGHLMRRAGFGASYAELQQRAAKGVDATIQELLDGAMAPDDGKSDWILETALRQDRQKQLRPQILKPWWLHRMITTPNPLQEKMVLFWHGHFATSAGKVNRGEFMLQQNRFFRDNAVGNWRTILKGISRDPAMILWLDNNTNFKAHANENYGRELMELFSLGIGNYTEQDVKQGSRAFTGWTIAYDRDTGGGFRFNPQQHDTGIKTYLGRTGNFDGDDVVDIILDQPAAAEFLTKKLFTFFAYDNPEPHVIASLADTFRKSNYDTRALMEAIFKSQAFWSEKAYNSQIKSPTQLIVGTARMLGYGQQAGAGPDGQAGMDSMGGAMDTMNQAGRRRQRQAIWFTAANSLKQMGQDLFYPPNVKGWDGGPTWINSATMLERVNFAVKMANTLRPLGGPGSLQQLVGDTANGDPAQLVDALAANLGPVELPAPAHTALAKAIAGDGTTLAANNRGYQRVARLRTAAGLIMQSPLYQLC